MNKFLGILLLLGICLMLPSQELQHEAVAVNIEVPVRVYDGDRFVDDLRIDDFEVFEEGQKQRIEAMYLIKKSDVKRRDEVKKYTPQTSRYFYLHFEISEYTPRLNEALEYFFQNVLLPEDVLVIISPLKAYSLKREALENMSKEELVSQVRGILRRDALMGNSEYRNIVDDLKGIAMQLTASLGDPRTGAIIDPAAGNILLQANHSADFLLNEYAALLSRLESLRKVEEKQILGFADLLKETEGQKNVFLFYQREFIPQVKATVLNQFMEMHQNEPQILHNISYLFDFYHRDLHFNVKRVKQAFSDSSCAIHFLFFTKPAEHISGVSMVEHSEDIYSTFKEMATATGGVTVSSANPDFLMHKAFEASENYYLVYYTPQNYKADGKFKKIEVKIKGKSYFVTHRTGYIAD